MEDNNYPLFNREDCPNKIVEYLDKRNNERHKMLSDQINDYHLDMLGIKQSIVNHAYVLRLVGVVLIVLIVLFTTKSVH